MTKGNKLCGRLLSIKDHFKVFNTLKNGGVLRLGKFGMLDVALRITNKYPIGFYWEILIDGEPTRPIVEWNLESNKPKKAPVVKKQKITNEGKNTVTVGEEENAW